MDITRATREWEPTTVPVGTVDDALAALDGRPTVVLTGAGMSTDSGIPDYRGPGAARATPMLYQDFVRSVEARRRYWARAFVGWATMGEAAPNAGHRALVEWERAGSPTPLVGVVTQNVDGLHERAGSQRLVTLHGRIADVVCLSCRQLTSREEMQARLVELNPGFLALAANIPRISHDQGHLPSRPQNPRDPDAHSRLRPDGDAVVEQWEGFAVADCLRCGGPLKPDVVFFGEPVPAHRVATATAWVAGAGAILTAGTSLTVMSGLRFVRQAARDGKLVVVVNLGHTRADELADVKLDARTTEVLTALVDRRQLGAADQR